MAKIELFNEDCMVGMARYPDKHFDLAIVDPPYGINAGKMKFGNGKKYASGKIVDRKVFGGKDWDISVPKSEYFTELFRVSKNQVIWGGNYFFDFLPSTRCFVFWDKGNSIKGRDFADGELAWTSFDKNAREIELNPHDSDRIHPTQKPVKLYQNILKLFASEGDLILDTHLGSGSSALACHDYGFDFIGYETDKSYFDAASKRLSQHQSQLKLI